MTEYRQLLGVSETATVDEIKKAYRQLAMQYHPDRNNHPDAEQTFKIIHSAYRALVENSNVDTTKVAAYKFSISLAEAYTGKTVAIGKIRITVPPGSRSGAKFFVNNKIYVLDVQHDQRFKRSGDHLLVDVTVDAITAILGTSIVVDHLDKSVLKFTIPAGIQPGQVLKLESKGMINPETKIYGDMLIRISVSIPRDLSDSDIDLIKQLKHSKFVNF